MNNRKWTSVRCFVLLLASLAPVAWADTLVLQNTGADAKMGGVSTSPYWISVNGTPMLLISDDFTTSVLSGETWTATPATLTQINSSTVNGLKFNTAPYSANDLNSSSLYSLSGASNVVSDYAIAAVLATELMTLPNVGTSSENTETAGELSYAIWSLFDSSLYTSLNVTGNTGFGALNSTEVSAVDNDLSNAAALVAAATSGGAVTLDDISINGQPITNLTVYTPNSPNGLASSQEFVAINTVATPEPSGSVMAALAGLAAFVAARRRRARRATTIKISSLS